MGFSLMTKRAQGLGRALMAWPAAACCGTWGLSPLLVLQSWCSFLPSTKDYLLFCIRQPELSAAHLTFPSNSEGQPKLLLRGAEPAGQRSSNVLPEGLEAADL